MTFGWLATAAAIDESLHGPLPGDLVDTQGQYLLKRPSTPIYSQEHDLKFSQHLTERLESLVNIQNFRTHKYGVDVAEEYPISHTPIEIKSSWETEQAAFDKFLDELPPTPSDDGTPMSTMSGQTLVSFKHQHTMSVSEKIELLGCIKVDEEDTSCHLKPVSQTKLSHLDNSSNTSLQNLFQQTSIQPSSIQLKSGTSMQSPPPRNNLKRRHSDAENDYPGVQHQKRRFAAPALHRLISVG